MIGFWISAGAMVLMVALVLVQTLRHAQASEPTADNAADLAVYRDQLAEVERDLTRGTLPEAEAGRLRIEVQRRMLDADKRSGTISAPPSKSLPAIAGVVGLAFVAAAGIYWSIGVPGYPDLPLSERLAAADSVYKARPSQEKAEAAQPAFTQPADLDTAVATLITRLRAAVANRPDDLQGHIFLAQNEASIGNFVAARKAQEVVVALKGDAVTADDLAFQANLMVSAAGGLVTPEAEQVLIACLRLDPRNGWARFYSGLMFAEIGRPDRAFGLWQPLLAESAQDAPWYAPIRGEIEGVAAAAGIRYTPPSAGPGPNAADVAAAGQMSAEDRTTMIRTMVGGLEERLTTDGGPVEEWAKLITSLGVLNEPDRAKAALEKAQAAFAGKPGELAALHAAAVQAGITQ